MREARRAKVPGRREGAYTLGLLLLGLVFPTRELGSTAIFGRAWMWGESSSRQFRGARTVWFVDGLEVVQHLLYALTALWALALIGGSRRTRGNLRLLAFMLLLDLLRGAAVDGAQTLALSRPMFWAFFAAWGALSLSSARPRV